MNLFINIAFFFSLLEFTKNSIFTCFQSFFIISILLSSIKCST